MSIGRGLNEGYEREYDLWRNKIDSWKKISIRSVHRVIR